MLSKSVLALQTVFDTCINLFIILLKGSLKGRVAFRGIKRKSNSLIIAMNGPSLKNDLEKCQYDLSKNQSMLVANHFGDIELFEELKPKFYVLSDPYFWEGNVSSDLIEKRNNTFKRLNNVVNWDIKLFVPNPRAESFIRSKINNTNINICRFNGSGYPVNYNKFIKFFWLKGVLSPFAQNVLIHSIYVGIMLKFKTIKLIGANFSFHESIFIDQNTNEFYKVRRHFYGVHKEKAYSDHTKTTSATIEDEYSALYKAYKTLNGLALFAQELGVSVINYTENSYLDMFKRPK